MEKFLRWKLGIVAGLMKEMGRVVVKLKGARLLGSGFVWSVGNTGILFCMCCLKEREFHILGIWYLNAIFGQICIFSLLSCVCCSHLAQFWLFVLWMMIALEIRLKTAQMKNMTFCFDKSRRYQWKWPEGSWTILQPLTGLTEVAQLRGPDRNGFYTKMRTRDLRGGGDGSTFGSMGSHGSRGDEKPYCTAGENCVKYLGGPLRSYTGKAMKSTMLEVVIRPPITTLVEDVKATGIVEEVNADSVGDILVRVQKKDHAVNGEKVEIVVDTSTKAELTVAEGQSADTDNANATNLNKKLGMEFENVGGLDAQLDDIARRVLASRANPQAARRLGVSHVRGILLSGPPGEYIKYFAYHCHVIFNEEYFLQ